VSEPTLHCDATALAARVGYESLGSVVGECVASVYRSFEDVDEFRQPSREI